MKNNKVVLITTAIKPPEGVFFLNMTDTSMRLLTAKAATFYWASLGVNEIVIADATGTNLLSEDDENLLKNIGVNIEQISYAQNIELILEYGKGYGEGALIDFAIHNSKILNNNNNFFKCTGKIFCTNFLEINEMIVNGNVDNIIWRDPLNSDSADTRFYYTNKEYCKNKLIPAYYEVRDRIGIYSEKTILEIAKENMKVAYGLRPLLYGFSGSTNSLYFNGSLGFLDGKFPCWINTK